MSNTFSDTPQHAGFGTSLQTMTYGGTLTKTAGMFAVVVLAGAVAWAAGPALWGLMAIGGSLGALALGLILSFKKVPSPALSIAYAALQGLALGAISASLQTFHSGIVTYAILATLCTTAAVFLLFRSGKVRSSPKITKIFLVAMVGYLIFSLVSFGLSVFNVMPGGLREVEIFGMPLGLPLGILAILMASYALILDFEDIRDGVEGHEPQINEWRGAFSLTATVVWMYVEYLRLLTYLLPSD